MSTKKREYIKLSGQFSPLIRSVLDGSNKHDCIFNTFKKKFSDGFKSLDLIFLEKEINKAIEVSKQSMFGKKDYTAISLRVKLKKASENPFVMLKDLKTIGYSVMLNKLEIDTLQEMCIKYQIFKHDKIVVGILIKIEETIKEYEK